MKNLRKNLLIFSLALTTFFTSCFTIPVFATSEITSTENIDNNSSEALENTESTEIVPTPEVTPTPTPEPTPEVNSTIITIVAKNLDTEQRIDTALFSIKDNNGNLLTFAKTSDGEYQYTTSGTLKALEVDYKGKVKITNIPFLMLFTLI